MYSSGSSSKPSSSATSSSCFTLKQSLIYFRKTRPSTTLLYSAASRLPRNSFAGSHNVCSIVFLATSFVFFAMAIKAKNSYAIPAGRPKPIRQRRSFVYFLFLFFRSLEQLHFVCKGNILSWIYLHNQSICVRKLKIYLKIECRS